MIRFPLNWLVLLICLGWQTVSLSAAERPNIVLCMGDDHGWEETGYNGHPHVRTPVLDEMASTGLRLERFYAAHPSCSPTRASFLTGRHPNRMGTFAPGWSLRPEEITLAEILSGAGYRCGHFGKWHVGAVKQASPVSPGGMGFDSWLAHDNFFEMNPSLSRDGAPPQIFAGESSQVLVDAAIEFIDAAQADNQPYFVVIWFGSPHEPYSGLPEDLALYDDLPEQYSKKVKLTSNQTGQQVRRSQGEVLRERYAEITAMDRAIGSLRSQLGERELRDDTFLFYCGDNGTSADAALGGPHRGVKGQVYEGGTLVPAVIEWPAGISQSRSTPVRASTSDLLPTICGLLGEPLPSRPLDGVDLSGLLKGQLTERSEPIYFWMYDTRRLTRGEPRPWIEPDLQRGTTPLVKLMNGKLTRDFKNFHHPVITAEDYRGPRAIIDGQHKLVIHELGTGDVKYELFDLQTDPAESNNIIVDLPETAERMKTQMRDWQTAVLSSLSGEDY